MSSIDLKNKVCACTKEHYEQLLKEGFIVHSKKFYDGDRSFPTDKDYDYIRLENTENKIKSMFFGSYTTVIIFGELQPHTEELRVKGLEEVELENSQWVLKKHKDIRDGYRKSKRISTKR